jgi:aminomethyltransferase
VLVVISTDIYTLTIRRRMVVGDIAGLKAGEGKLSLIMNENGGIVDDTVITNAGQYIYMVVNGACKQKDIAHFQKYLQGSGLDVKMEHLEDRQLLALQVNTFKFVCRTIN